MGRRIAFPRAAIVLVWVIALHVALAWLLLDSIAARALRQAVPAPPQRVTMRLIPPPEAPPPRAAEAPPNPPAAATARAPARSLARAPNPTDPAPLSFTPAAPSELASHAEPAGSAPRAIPSLMDTEATRRAIRDSARQPAHIGHVAGAGDEPRRASTQERLAGDVKAAGKGDCVKGEYLGAGMGLLSLPFLAVAAARGACAQ